MSNIIKPDFAKRVRPSLNADEALSRINARLSEGATVKEACEAVGVPAPTYYRWRAARRDSSATEATAGSRAVILDAAKRVFLREGFGVSMNTIADRAGVARQTLFNRFGNKERLFREVIHSIFERLMHPLMTIDPALEVRPALNSFAHQFLDLAFDPEGIALHRVTIAELHEFPDLARLVQSLGVTRAIPVLADYLRDSVARGRIKPCDPELVAECFLSSVTGQSRHRAIMGTETDSRSKIEARLRLSVEVFVRSLEI